VQSLSPFEIRQRCAWLERTNQSWIHPDEDEWTCTHPAFQPSPNENHHFFHYIWKLSDSTLKWIWYWNLLSWPASTCMLIARLFIASYNSFSVFRCCENDQWSCWRWKQKKSLLCTHPKYRRIQHVWRDSATSSQTTYRNNSQQSITLLIAVPRLMNIPASFAEAEQYRADCNSSSFTTSSLIRRSTAFGSMSWLYNCI